MTSHQLAGAIHWPVAPARLQLEKTGAHVWAASLHTAPTVLTSLARTLSEAEQERAARFKFEPGRKRFIAGRGLLRAILGRYLQTGPAELKFVYGPHGKPALSAEFAGAEIHFNLAHSDDLALIAVTRAGAVGVDVERIRPVKDAEALVARFFSPRESGLFQRLAADEKPPAFLTLWTRKEALLKATGEGITRSLSLVEVSFLPGEAARLLAIAGDAEKAAQWTLHDLSPMDGFVGAVAVHAQNINVRCWRWK